MADDILATAPVLRFAPSPNGALHLGHAYSALMNERLAAETGGRLILRIEDLDRARCKPRVRGRDRRRPRVARTSLSCALAPPERASRRLRGGAGAPRPAGPRLPLLLHPLGGRARLGRPSRPGRRRRSTPEPAARSPRPKRAPASRAARGRPSASTWAARSPPRRRISPGSNMAKAPFHPSVRRRRRPGATSSSAAAIWRRATIWRWSSTMRCKA